MINEELSLKYCICNREIKEIVEYAMRNTSEIRNGYHRIEPFCYSFENEQKIGKDVLPTAIDNFIIQFIIPDFKGSKSDLEDEIWLQVNAIILRYLQPANHIFKIYETGYPDEDSISMERPEYRVVYSNDFGNAYLEFIKKCMNDRENDKIGINCSFDKHLKFKYSEFKSYASIITLEPIKTID